MALDASIALGGQRPAPQQEPLAGLASLMQLVHAVQANRAEQMKIAQMEQTLPLDLETKRYAIAKARQEQDILSQFMSGAASPSLGAGGQANVSTGDVKPPESDYEKRVRLTSLLSLINPTTSNAVGNALKVQYPDKVREAFSLGYRPGTPPFNNFVGGIASQGGVFSAPDEEGNRKPDPNYAASQGAVKAAEEAAKAQFETVNVWGMGPDGKRREFQILKSQLPEFMRERLGETQTPQSAPVPGAPQGVSIPQTAPIGNLASEGSLRSVIGGIPKEPATPPGATTQQRAEALFNNQPGLPAINRIPMGVGAPTKAETELTVKRVDKDVERANTYSTEHDAARQSLNDLRIMRAQIQNGMMGGRLAPGLQAAGEFLMGINAPLSDEIKQSLRSGQNFRKASEAAALSQVKSFVGGSQISDADRRAVEFIQPRLQDDPVARVQWMNYLESRAEDKLRVHRKADEYLTRNGNLNGFYAGAVLNMPRTRAIDPVTVLLPDGQVAKLPSPAAAKSFVERANRMEGVD